MTHTPHQLTEDFPDHADLIARLRAEHPHFAKLVRDYADINEQVHLAESMVHPTSSDHEDDLRSQRVRIKDQIWHLIQSANA